MKWLYISWAFTWFSFESKKFPWKTVKFYNIAITASQYAFIRYKCYTEQILKICIEGYDNKCLIKKKASLTK